MKTLFILVLVGGVAALGGVFFGLFEISGLERLPTLEGIGRKRVEAIEENVQHKMNGDEGVPTGPWGVTPGREPKPMKKPDPWGRAMGDF